MPAVHGVAIRHHLLSRYASYIHRRAKEAFLRRSARLLTPGGKIVFSLPIEVGPILLFRELARRWTGSWRDAYTLREIAAAVLFMPNAVVDEYTKQNLRGYDYRHDLRLIRSLFTVEKIAYSPLPFAGPLNPFLVCQAAVKSTC